MQQVLVRLGNLKILSSLLKSFEIGMGYAFCKITARC